MYTEEGTTKTDYLSVGGHTVVELRKTGTTTTPTYLHPDLLGSPRKATNQSKSVLWSEHYDPYGLKLNGVKQKIGYTGHAHDAESGYTYMQARFYDPLVGRFLSTDPVHFVDQDPFTFNRYSYANNNPYRYIDPFGLSSCGTGSHIRGRGGVQCRSSAPGKSNNGETTSAERASVGKGNGGTERHRTLKQLRNDNPLNDYSDRVSRSQRRTGLGDIHADIPKDSLVKTSEQIMEWTVGPFLGVYGGAITLRAGLIIRSAMQQAHVKPLDLAQVIAEITNSFNPNALPPRAMLPNSTPVIERAVPATPIIVGP